MIKEDEMSNAQSWELEVTCKSKKYLDAVVKMLLKHNVINFEVNLVDVSVCNDDEFDARYTIFMWCNWFNNLSLVAKDLAKIEKRFDYGE